MQPQIITLTPDARGIELDNGQTERKLYFDKLVVYEGKVHRAVEYSGVVFASEITGSNVWSLFK